MHVSVGSTAVAGHKLTQFTTSVSLSLPLADTNYA